MGRGLSDLQDTILRMALANRDVGRFDGADVYDAEVLARYFGWDGIPTSHDRGPRFSVGAIGPGRYRSARASLSRAMGRLALRGLVIRVSTMCRRSSGVVLTEEGVDRARSLSVNKIA